MKEISDLLSKKIMVLQAFPGTEGLRASSKPLLLPSGYHASREKNGTRSLRNPFAESDTGYHDDRSGRIKHLV